MNRTRNNILQILIAGGAATCIAANAATITNGSFEAPGGAPIRVRLSEIILPGWSYNDLGFAIYESSGQDDIAAQQGTYYISFGHNNGSGEVLGQSFQTLASETLYVSFFVSEQQKGNALRDTEVVRVDLTNGSLVYSQDIAINGSVWTMVNLPAFVSNGGTTTLTFTNISSAEVTNWALDNVTVSNTAPVPEPSAYLMFILGLGALSRCALRSGRGEA